MACPAGVVHCSHRDLGRTVFAGGMNTEFGDISDFPIVPIGILWLT